MSQSVNGEWTDYTLDLATGLTQVLDDGTNGYLYGIGRIGEEHEEGGWQFHLGDALGSVRQLTNAGPEVTQVKSFQPFGDLLMGFGTTESVYGFTGEWKDATGLVNLRARYYASSNGRFISNDIWVGDHYSPLSFNGWLYGYANPILYTDPFGFAASAERRLDQIIDEVWPNSAEALFRAFEDAELQSTWGHQAGQTLKDRLFWLLDVTTGYPKYPEIPDPLLTFLGFQFGKPFGLDCGFAEEFRDSHLYQKRWDLDPSESNQVGHFLSAVSLTYRFVIPQEIIKGLPQLSQEPEALFWGDLALAMIIGHEQMPDRPEGLKAAINQATSPTTTDVDRWYEAVDLDYRGKYHQRDTKLWEILRFDSDIPFNDADPSRVGNSIQDLRLSLKGYRFGWYVYKNQYSSPLAGGYWLRINLGVNRHLMNPFGP